MRFAILLSVAVLVLMGGCRFGNYIQEAPKPESLSSYYETRAETLQVCALIDKGPTEPAVENCIERPVAEVPTTLSTLMTNPVFFQEGKAVTGGIKTAAILSLDEKRSMGLLVDETNALSFESEPQEVALEKDPATQKPICSDVFTVDATGKLQKAAQSYEITVGKTKVPVKGRVELRFIVMEEFKGECGTTMEAMYQCYIGNPACSVELQEVVKGTFAPYIEAGAMTEEDIPVVSAISYEVSYQ